MHFERRTAFYSTLILTVSIWFVFARKIMPDTFSTALVIIALYHAFNYWKFNKPYSVLWFALIGCLGVLAKIPSVILIASLGTVFFSKGIFTLKKTALLVGTALIAVASYGWYFVWNPSLGQQYAGWSNDNRSIAEGINDLLGHLSGLAEIFYFNAMQGFIFSIFIVVGLVYAFINKEGKILWTTAFITAVLFIYMFKAGYYFVQNNYYIIPFVPVLALISGYGITRLNKRWRMIILAFGMIEAVANQQHDFFIDDNVQYKMTIEEVLNSSINESADIAIFSNSQNHLLMYLAHRKGWMLFEQDAQNQTVLKDIKSKGCEYLVVDRHIHEDLQVVQDKVFENEDFRVYRL
jgi:hypothetical protein